MSKEITQIRKALVEAIAAQKLIQKNIVKAKEDMTKWQERSHGASPAEQPEVDEEVGVRILNLKALIAELEADLMAQHDLEEQLKATLFRLEHTVQTAPPPNISNLEVVDETIERMEGKILKGEALAELSSNDKERKLEEAERSILLDEELQALKQSMKKKKED